MKWISIILFFICITGFSQRFETQIKAIHYGEDSSYFCWNDRYNIVHSRWVKSCLTINTYYLEKNEVNLIWKTKSGMKIIMIVGGETILNKMIKPFKAGNYKYKFYIK